MGSSVGGGPARTVAGLGLALGLLLAGCGGPGAPSGADSGGAVGGGAAVPEDGSPPKPEGAPTDADPDRQVVTTATAYLVVDDPADGAQEISELVESVGGRVDERSEQSGAGPDGSDGSTADLVVRVPADELTGVLADLEGLGELASVSVSHSDVTASAVDLDARISALQTSVTRLQTLMSQATSTQDLLDAEEVLAERQGELESLQSQRALLADQVALSTLDVHLSTPGVVPAGGPENFVDGFATGWRALVTALTTGLIGIGVLLPWLVVLALGAVAVLVPIRLRARHRSREA